MALAVTATQSGTSVNVAWSGATGTVTLYRSVNSADVASTSAITAAITAGTLVKLNQFTASSGTYADETIVGSETYYYVAKDSSGSANTNLTTTVTAEACCLTDTSALLVKAQNAAAAKDFSIGVDTAYVYLVAITSSTAISDSSITGITSPGTGGAVTKLASAQVTTVTGYQPALVGDVTIRYDK